MGLETHHVSEDEFLVTRVRAVLDGLAVDPRQPLCEQVAAQLAELGSVLTAHMDEEENTILPLAAEHLSVAEQEELGEISLAKLDKKHLLRAFSALMAVATPEEQRTLLTKAPLPARLLWRLSGRRSHARWEARLYGA